jgi:hypothetical protein
LLALRKGSFKKEKLSEREAVRKGSCQKGKLSEREALSCKKEKLLERDLQLITYSL